MGTQVCAAMQGQEGQDRIKNFLNVGESVLKLEEIMWKSDFEQLYIKVKGMYVCVYNFFFKLVYLCSFIFYMAGGKTFQPTFIDLIQFTIQKTPSI
jgi:hypothetical protein